MCDSGKKRINYAELVKYRLPIYNKKSKDKIVYYYVLDPQSVIDGTPRLKRLRKKFNHIHSMKERDEAATRFVLELSARLKAGWNPLMDTSRRKESVLISDVFDIYEKHLKKLNSDKVLKDKTRIDYLYRMNALRQYIEHVSPISYASCINREYIEDFLDYVYYERMNTPRTRNNYLNWLGSFCGWLTDKGYAKNIGVEHIKKLPEYDKKRKPLEKSDMRQLHDYLELHNPNFLVACQVHYYTLVRPGELSWIKLQDISLKEQTMFVSKSISKNRRDAKVTLPKKVIQHMLERGFFNNPDSYYLFGNNFYPSPEHADSRIFRDEWSKVRKALNWPDYYQFYSLKDTGITDAIDKVGLTITKDQARHSDISTTNKYVKKEQLRAHPELKDYEGDL